MPTLIGASTGWSIGLVLGVVVVLVAAAIVITIVVLATRIAAQARTAVSGVTKVREQTDALDGVGRINDSGVRILHSARALRKVAVGK
jgi:ABC-type transporter Mla maintaining outer membrane lipid asymmetry permease subunit MlaE